MWGLDVFNVNVDLLRQENYGYKDKKLKMEL